MGHRNCKDGPIGRLYVKIEKVDNRRAADIPSAVFPGLVQEMVELDSRAA